MIMEIDKLRTIFIGREADGGVEKIEIDCSAWVKAYPNLTDYRIEVTSPEGIVYLPVIERQGNLLMWPITQSDTAKKGQGMYQVVATGAEGERKTSAYHALNVVSIMPGTATDEVPSPAQPWVDNVLDAANRAEEAAKRAAEIASGVTPGGGGSFAAITINGQKPDETGNFVVNTVTDVEIAQLNAALT